MLSVKATKNVRKSEPPLLNPTVFSVNVVPGEKADVYIIQLIEKLEDDSVTVAVTQRSWQEFIQLDLLVRSVAPKFDRSRKGQQNLAYMQTYLTSVISVRSLSCMKEVQDFLGYTSYCQKKLWHSEENSFAVFGTALSRGSGAPVLNSDSGNNRCDREEKDGLNGYGNVFSSEHERMLEECFSIMDAGFAGYITPEDMKEFCLCVDPGGSTMQQLRNDEPYDCKCFIAFVHSVLCGGKVPFTIEEWVDRYWLLQYRKIYMATATLVNCGGENTEFLSRLIDGFDAFELASLAYVITEAGMRLVSAAEVEKWVRGRRHQRACGFTMERLSALLDALSKAIPFSELWFCLLPHHDCTQRVLQLVATYSTVVDETVREEIWENVIQQRRAAADEQCGNCARLEETLKLQSQRLVEAVAAQESLAVKVRYLQERLEATAVLRRDYQNMQKLLDEAELREAELCEKLICMELGGNSARGNAGAPSPPADAATLLSPVLQLLPCGAVAQHIQPLGSALPNPSSSFYPPLLPSSALLNTAGAVAYSLPQEWSLPSKLCVDVFWCDTTCSGKDKTERFVCRDASGRRSCAFLFKNSQLRIVTQKDSCGDKCLFYLAVGCWYRLCCTFDWCKKTFCVELVKCGGNKSSAKDAAVSPLTYGPLAMIEQNASGLAVVDIFPRKELLVSYCNFFLQYAS